MTYRLVYPWLQSNYRTFPSTSEGPSCLLAVNPALNCSPRQPRTCFLSINLPFLDISYIKWNDKICGLSLLDSFIQCKGFEVHPRCSLYQQFAPFCSLGSHLMDVTFCLCILIDGHLKVQFLVIWNNAAMNVHVTVLVHVFISLG
uniref:Uncharacterized protein n=1 Tax=Myotis myotis TaxID=51298 RepID=A0A7J7T5N6_MYOMY|nr:hypothetical protein mMyoMyo1_009151 [Myotis myotis]